MELWERLESRGLTRKKLTELKKKSLALAGKSNYHRDSYQDAREQLQLALQLIPEPERGVSKEAEELGKWLERVEVKAAQALKKEKAMWGKAFKQDKESPAEELPVVNDKGATKKKKKVTFGPGESRASSSSSTTLTKNYGWLLGAVGLASFLGGSLFFYFRNRKLSASRW